MTMVASPDSVVDAAPLTEWEPAAHPKMTGFFCLARKRGEKTEHHQCDDSVAMYWSRGEAASAARNLPRA